MSGLYTVKGTFSARIYADSKEDAEATFHPFDIVNYEIMSVEAEEDNE